MGTTRNTLGNNGNLDGDSKKKTWHFMNEYRTFDEHASGKFTWDFILNMLYQSHKSTSVSKSYMSKESTLCLNPDQNVFELTELFWGGL